MLSLLAKFFLEQVRQDNLRKGCRAVSGQIQEPGQWPGMRLSSSFRHGLPNVTVGLAAKCCSSSSPNWGGGGGGEGGLAIILCNTGWLGRGGATSRHHKLRGSWKYFSTFQRMVRGGSWPVQKSESMCAPQQTYRWEISALSLHNI